MPQKNLFRYFPLVWLGYLYFPVAEFLQRPHLPAVQAGGAVGLLLFVVLWLRAFHLLPGKQTHWPWVRAGYLFSLALFFAAYPFVGPTAVTMLIYGASLIGFQGSLSVAALGLLVAVAALPIPGALGWGERVGVVEALPWLAFAAVGCYSNFASYRQWHTNRRLAQVQLEKEKLAQLAERERIARDLHDLLGHTLSVIVLKSELASKLAARDPERAVQEIREVERISREALSEVRAAVRGYRAQGLGAELERSKVALGAAGIALEYDGGGVRALPMAVEATLELVLREAVTNVVRHSQARTCRVRLERVGNALELEVSDDGVGGDGREESGLTGMRERVRALGGTLTRDGRAGTRLCARVPLSGGPKGIGPRPSPAGEVHG